MIEELINWRNDLKYFHFAWNADNLHFRTHRKEGGQASFKPMIVAVAEDVPNGPDDDKYKAVRPALPLFQRYIGDFVSGTGNADQYDDIGHFVYKGVHTKGQRALQRVIEDAQDELGSIKLVSVVAWQEGDDAATSTGDVPVIRLRIEAKEEEHRRVLNLVRDKIGGLAVDDPTDLAAKITALF